MTNKNLLFDTPCNIKVEDRSRQLEEENKRCDDLTMVNPYFCCCKEISKLNNVTSLILILITSFSISCGQKTVHYRLESKNWKLHWLSSKKGCRVGKGEKEKTK
jgi:hypothetical protein